MHVWVSLVGILLVILYTFLIAIGVWMVGYNNLEVDLYAFALVSALGVIYKKEWARKALITVSAVSFFFEIINMVWSPKGINLLSVLLTFLFGSIVCFYRQSFVKTQFGKFPASSNKQILLIDDDKTLLRMMGTNFLSKGMTLLTAESGEKGLEIAACKNVDLIILDVILPRMKGREVCSRLKENSRTRDIPIIFLTVKDSPDDIRAELEAGAVSHLTKPVSFPELYQEIKKILGE